MCEADVAYLTIANRDVEKAQNLANLLSKEMEFSATFAKPLTETYGDGFDMIINCTSLGLCEDDALPIVLDYVNAGTVIADIIMMPAETKWIKDAISRGLPIHYGRHMLDYRIDLIGKFIDAL